MLCFFKTGQKKQKKTTTLVWWLVVQWNEKKLFFYFMIKYRRFSNNKKIQVWVLKLQCQYYDHTCEVEKQTNYFVWPIIVNYNQHVMFLGSCLKCPRF